MGKKTESAKKGAVAAKPAAKIVTPKATKPAAVKKPAAKTTVSSDDIALRAYFIAESRRAKGLPGDAHHDWIEAEKQLRAELKKPAAKVRAK